MPPSGPAQVVDAPANPVPPNPTVPPAGSSLSARAWLIAAVGVGALSVAALTLALHGQQRLKLLEQELVKRQQDSQGQAVEARALAKHAQEAAAAVEAKVALLEGRVSETALQRTQLEELIQQLSRSRDENVLADVEAALRVAVQQSAITGSAEPLASALRQAEERLARLAQPRIERVRRALARDIDRVKSVAIADMASLTIKLDEAVRLVDELPLLSQPERRASAPASGRKPASPPTDAQAAAAAPEWLQAVRDGWSRFATVVADEVRSLVRVTRIEHPEGMLVTPEQAWFLRENLKLRLLNARLALLSRQFDTVQTDLRATQSILERYFDRSSRRVLTTSELLRQVAQLARNVSVPRPDETLAAIAAAQAGR
jgi:uroporphyrin-3 C-methyltransferase